MTDNRVDPPFEADERTTLTAFLDFLRDTLAFKCEGLTDEQLATTPGFTVLEAGEPRGSLASDGGPGITLCTGSRPPPHRHHVPGSAAQGWMAPWSLRAERAHCAAS